MIVSLIRLLRLWLFLFLIFQSSLSFSQFAKDIVYTKQGTTIEGAIKSVNSSHLLLDNNHTINLADMAIGIRANGDILTIIHPENNYRWIKNDAKEYHKIITLNKEVFAAESVELINKKVGFQDYFNGWYFLIDASEVALIIYNNGMHEMMCDPEIANRCLAEVTDFNSYDRSREPNTATIKLTPDEQSYFARRARKKTEAFGSYLSILSDASKGQLEQYDAVQLALNLFYDEERLVEVSSLNRDERIFYKIREYLDHIRTLTYARVKMEWCQVDYINQIIKGKDGEYHGIIAVEQIFKAYNNDDYLVYQDVTRKNIKIVLKPIEQIIDTTKVIKWDVFLSDIGVNDTSAR